MNEKTPTEKSLNGSDTHVEDIEDERLKREHEAIIAGNLDENINAKLENPLEGIPRAQLLRDAEAFAKKHGLGEHIDEFRKGALVAQDPLAFEKLDILTEEEKTQLRREITHKWSQPKTLYALVVMCSVAAAVQGVRTVNFIFSSIPETDCYHDRVIQMDETVINGAQLFFAPQVINQAYKYFCRYSSRRPSIVWH